VTSVRPAPDVTVRRVDPRSDRAWAQLAAGPGGSLFVAPPWMSAVSDTYGFVPLASVAEDAAGQPQAGMAWTDVRDLRGERRLALPFSDRADPVLSYAELWPNVAAEPLAGDLPLTLRCLHTSPAVADPRFTAVGEAAWHLTSLDRPLDELQRALRPATRRNIHAAKRAGVEVVLRSDADAVTQYHRLHVELRRRKYRMLAQPAEFFHNIWACFEPSGGIQTALALVDGSPVAGAIYVIWQDTVYYKFGASRAEFLSLRPNDALHWHLINWAHEHGYAALDWGLSELSQPGLLGYKRGWASTEGRIITLKAGGSPRGRPQDTDELFATLTELLTDPSVPDSVTARAGAALYRYFC
jgi:CelD/BcsL family acetyltransferase involved in cellulose biosynthesis